MAIKTREKARTIRLLRLRERTIQRRPPTKKKVINETMEEKFTAIDNDYPHHKISFGFLQSETAKIYIT